MSDWGIIEVKRHGLSWNGRFTYFSVRWKDSRGYYYMKSVDLETKQDPTELHAILHAQRLYIEPHERHLQHVQGFHNAKNNYLKTFKKTEKTQ